MKEKAHSSLSLHVDPIKVSNFSFPTQKNHIIFILLHFLSFICFCFPYYSLDVCIYGIKSRIENSSDDSSFEDQLIIAEYISNIATPVVAGFIIDYAGGRYVLISVNILAIFSQIIIFLWIQFDHISFEYLMMARILFVVSFEGFFVASITVLARWCIHNSFSTAINMSFILGEGFIYIVIYLISYYYSSSIGSITYLYAIILAGTILMFVSFLFNFFILTLFKKLEFEQEANPKDLNSLWKSIQHVSTFKFFCLYINFGLISSSFNWFVQYYDSYLSTFFSSDIQKKESYLGLAQLYEGVPYLILFCMALFMAKFLKDHSYRIIYLLLASIFLLISNLYFYFSLSFKSSDPSINWFLSTICVILLGIGYSIHYSVVYTCIPLLNFTRGNHTKNIREIGMKFGIMRWARSLFNFFMFLAISNFNPSFDHFWISSVFIFVGIILYCVLIGKYDRKLFRVKELNHSKKIKRNILMDNEEKVESITHKKLDENFLEEEEKE